MFRLFMDAKAMNAHDVRFLSALIYNFDLTEFTVLPLDRVVKLFRVKNMALSTEKCIRNALRGLRNRGILEEGPEVAGSPTYRLRPDLWATPESVADHARQCRATAERLALLPRTYNPEIAVPALYQHLVAVRLSRTRGKTANASRERFRNQRTTKRATT